MGIIFVALKTGADRRVMGIALAMETAPRMGWFFCLHRTIYTLGVLWIKPAAAGLGQLCICTCHPCPGEDQAKAERIACNNTAVIRADQEVP